MYIQYIFKMIMNYEGGADSYPCERSEGLLGWITFGISITCLHSTA